MRDARPLTQPRASSPPKNSPRGNSLAIRNTEPRAIISFKCAITVMPRLAVSLGRQEFARQRPSLFRTEIPLMKLCTGVGQQQTPAVSAFTGAT